MNQKQLARERAEADERAFGEINRILLAVAEGQMSYPEATGQIRAALKLNDRLDAAVKQANEQWAQQALNGRRDVKAA